MSDLEIEEGLYYLWSENKGADQLRGNREADLRLCFRICKMLVFSCLCSYYSHKSGIQIKIRCTQWFILDRKNA